MNVTFLFGAGSELEYSMPLGNSFIQEVLFRYIGHEVNLDNKVIKKIDYLFAGIKNIDTNIYARCLDECVSYFELIGFDYNEYDWHNFNTNNIMIFLGFDVTIDESFFTLSILPFLLYINMCYIQNNENVNYLESIRNFTLTLPIKQTYAKLETGRYKDIYAFYISTIFLLRNKKGINILNSHYYTRNKVTQTRFHEIITLAKNCIFKILSNVLNYNELLLSLIVEYMKNGDLTYFKLSHIANDYLYTKSKKINPLALDSTYTYIRYFFSMNSSFKFLSPFTANYTKFAEEIIGFPDVIHLHGELNNFYDFRTKSFVKNYIVPNDSNLIFESDIYPYLILQSSVKAIDDVEMTSRYHDMFNRLAEIDYLIIHGLSLNPDDNHITNLLIKACHKYAPRLKIRFLHYVNNITETSSTPTHLASKFSNLDFREVYYQGFTDYESFEFYLNKLLK